MGQQAAENRGRQQERSGKHLQDLDFSPSITHSIYTMAVVRPTRCLFAMLAMAATTSAASPRATSAASRCPAAFQAGLGLNGALPSTSMPVCSGRPAGALTASMSGSEGKLGRAAARIGKIASFFTGSRISSKRRAAGEERKRMVGPKAMFTGIVEEVGSVEEMVMDIKVPGVTLTLKGNAVLEGAYEGCSIAVNGVCLTVTKYTEKTFTVGIAPETLRLTNRESVQSP